MTVAGVGLSEDLSAAALGSVGGNDQLPTPRGRARLACDGHDQQIDIAHKSWSCLRHLNEMTFNI